MYPNGFNVDPDEARPVQRNSAIRSSYRPMIDVNNPQPVTNQLRTTHQTKPTTSKDFCPFDTPVEPQVEDFTDTIPLAQWSERKLAGYVEHFGEQPTGAHRDLFEQAWNIHLSRQHRSLEDNAPEDSEPEINIQDLLVERGRLVRRMMEIDLIVSRVRAAEERNQK